jgi:hypothetical protein
MALIYCPECMVQISEEARTCPQCGHPLKEEPQPVRVTPPTWWGYEWKSKTAIFGIPLIHIAAGRNKETGKFMVAKGIIAIGQFAFGFITIAQFGIGLLFGLGQFMGGTVALGQFAVGISFGLGQFATGAVAIGQFAFGEYVLAQIGYGKYVWSKTVKDPEAVEYFTNMWNALKGFFG